MTPASSREITSATVRSVKTRIATLATPRAGDELDPLGMPVRLHYTMFSVFALLLGGFPLLLTFTPEASTMVVWPLRAICVASVVLAWVYYRAGKRVGFKSEPRIYHVAGATTILLIAVAAFCVGDLRPALTAVIIITPISNGYYLSMRHGLPHMVAAGALILFASTQIGTPDSAVRIATLLLVMFGGWLMLYSTKMRLVAVLDQHRELSELDPLTGAANVRKLTAVLDREAARADRDGNAFALIEFDLDEFKNANDFYSHSTGDAVLVATVAAAKLKLTELDTIARRGGDEFSIVVPLILGRDIDKLCESIAKSVAERRRELCPDVKPTISIGWSPYVPGSSIAELVRLADEQVQSAKQVSREVEHSKEQANGSPRVIGDGKTATATTDPARDPRAAAIDPISVATAFAWRQAGVLYVTAALMYTALALAGASGMQNTVLGGTVVAGALGVAPVCWWMSTRRSVAVVMTHVLGVGTLAIIVALGAINPHAAGDMAELFILPILFQMYLLPTRTAVAYAVLTIALLAVTMSGYGVAYAALRAGTAVDGIALVSLVVAMSRRRTIDTVTENAELARVDALTGLPNLRRLRDRLTDEIARCETTGDRFSLIMLDLDDFKAINDRYGHSVGDATLVAVADALRGQVRRAEMPARRGGDEFAIVPIDTMGADPQSVIDRLGSAIAEARARICPDITPLASIGCAEWRPGDSVDDLLENADVALHEAKMNSHRERGVTAEPPPALIVAA
jgi:diguanylate cyclase (GGDEF)-like protein